MSVGDLERLALPDGVVDLLADALVERRAAHPNGLPVEIQFTTLNPSKLVSPLVAWVRYGDRYGSDQCRLVREGLAELAANALLALVALDGEERAS